jgi:thiosulfate/3-mercaptopyruvate sulfurtransferase
MINILNSFSLENIIETSELAKLINTEKVNTMRILDCSWFLPTENKNAKEMFLQERIPYSQFFDIDEVADKSQNLPHMMPDDSSFITQMKKMDIRKSDHIVCYDRAGIFSAPRVWFTFKIFGAQNVSVLNGGYPKWTSENLPVEKGQDFGLGKLTRPSATEKDFDYKLDRSKVINADEILKLSLRKQKGLTDEYIIDARSAPRYKGEVEEPRQTKRKGHVDLALNVFFKDLLDGNSCYKSENEILEEFRKRNINTDKNMTLYCGSGTTACIDILALAALGKFDNCRLYDGSWSEMVF